MRADRLLQIMALLRRHGRLPARRLAEILEVSERTILRDMEALSVAGVPVYTDRGRGGGCAILPGYRTEVSGLSPAEAQALFAWTSGSGASELGLSSELASALTKLSATVPAPAMQQAEALASVVVVDRRRWFADADEVPLLPLLRDAATRKRRVALTYASPSAGVRSERQPATTRTIDPFGLVENAGRWYLLAEHNGDPRTYRVSRIIAAEVLDESARVPDDLNLAQEWAARRAVFEQRGEPCTITVAVDPAVIESFGTHAQFQLAPGSVMVGLGDDAGWPQLQLTLRSWRAAMAMVLAYGGQARLLAPQYLRERALQLARGAVDAHERADDRATTPDPPHA